MTTLLIIVAVAAAGSAVGAPWTVWEIGTIVCVLGAIMGIRRASARTGERVSTAAKAVAAITAVAAWTALLFAVRPYDVFVLIGTAGVALLIESTRGPVTSKRRPGSHINADGTPKREYRNRNDAQEAAERLHAKDGAAMSAYKCEQGGHWHVGHQR